jgi:hypothetical protein
MSAEIDVTCVVANSQGNPHRDVTLFSFTVSKFSGFNSIGGPILSNPVPSSPGLFSGSSANSAASYQDSDGQLWISDFFIGPPGRPDAFKGGWNDTTDVFTLAFIGPINVKEGQPNSFTLNGTLKPHQNL